MNTPNWKSSDLCRVKDVEDKLFIVSSTHLLPETLIIQEIEVESTPFPIKEIMCIKHSTVETTLYNNLLEYVSISLGVNIEYPVGTVKAAGKMLELSEKLVGKI